MVSGLLNMSVQMQVGGADGALWVLLPGQQLVCSACAPVHEHPPPLHLPRLPAGPSQCDKRQPLDATQRQFPGVDFGLIESQLDLSWEAGHVESESSVVVRGFNFLNWLMQVG